GAGVVATRFQRREPRHLPTLGFRPNLERRDRRALALLVGVDPDDDSLVGFQLALEFERGIGDLPLEETALYAAQDAALLIDPIEVLLSAALHLVGQLL